MDFKSQPKPQISVKDSDIRFWSRSATFTHFCLFWKLRWQDLRYTYLKPLDIQDFIDQEKSSYSKMQFKSTSRAR